MKLKYLSKADLIRMVKGANLQIKRLEKKFQGEEGKVKKLFWIAGALVQKLGGSSVIDNEEMEQVLVTKRINTKQDEEAGTLTIELVDRFVAGEKQ